MQIIVYILMKLIHLLDDVAYYGMIKVTLEVIRYLCLMNHGHRLNCFVMLCWSPWQVKVSISMEY